MIEDKELGYWIAMSEDEFQFVKNLWEHAQRFRAAGQAAAFAIARDKNLQEARERLREHRDAYLKALRGDDEEGEEDDE